MRDFIRMLLRHRREAYFYFILHSFIELYRERHHLKEAVLTTAVPLGDSVREMIRKQMQDSCGCTVDVSVRIDPGIIGGFVFRGIIGGFVFRMEDTFIDASVASQLRTLRQRLGSNPVRKI